MPVSSWQELVDSLKKAPTMEERRKISLSASEWMEGADDGSCRFVVDAGFLNSQRYLNRHLIFVNQKMQMDGIFVCGFYSSEAHDRQLRKRHPKMYGFYRFWDFLWHRACPKMVLTRRFYFSIYKQVKRVYPMPEIYGRLSYCGFDIVHADMIDDTNLVVCRKKRLPSTDEHPSYNLLITLRRVGKNGRRFGVYKFRTMYAYSEYLQQYVYEQNALDSSGKFANDFRISGWGRKLRKYWLDELPMVWNILRGEMKLVGVRPLSEQYYSLYTPEMQQYRIRCKPGLLPPYYVDMPEGIEEVQQSEKKYLDAYFRHPFRTQWVYFWKILYSIIIKRHHSK
ncbi:MAG: sugar transferase [Bacteroidales bacterium]|nr:sugar transferase [Bacteroidales bacterium]